MMSVAMRTILMLHTFDTSGTVRDARGFASSTIHAAVLDGVLHVHEAHHVHFARRCASV